MISEQKLEENFTEADQDQWMISETVLGFAENWRNPINEGTARDGGHCGNDSFEVVGF